MRRRIGLFGVRRRHLRAAEKAHPERLERRRHRVRRVLSAACPDRRTCVSLDAVVVLLRHLARGVGADRLERRHDRQRLALPMSGKDRAGVDKDAGNVDARHRHHAAGHVLVAAADAHDAVHHLALYRDLDRVGDYLARHERIFHAFGAHADAVGHRGEAENLRHRALVLQRRHRAIDEGLNAGIAGVHRAVAVRDADDGLLEIVVAEAHGAQHRAVGRAGDALRDQFGAPVVSHDRLLCSGPGR